ncbi:hypothetical protein BKA67DRAFT_663299 [Truncatella angustata]|uniref:Uncharacterized protein n=1 Tax=Truncatella angustata TaxID=152316 RepID=A0A9P8RJE3_9PEZI|nr:uncharacterized protein BKA67DRAFT_663299 [Truncatella angustata]KAH6646934.1 hypothetical protein BKA67DRAFT_663299 [Truncatella angustata]
MTDAQSSKPGFEVTTSRQPTTDEHDLIWKPLYKPPMNGLEKKKEITLHSVVNNGITVVLIGRQDGHRAPPAAPWITDEELWFMDWAFKDTTRELLREDVTFKLGRFQGMPNFPPLQLDRGYGVALCVRRSKAARYIGPIEFRSVNDEVFIKKLQTLAYDVRKATFLHKDLVWSIRITTFFSQNPPTGAPKWWKPEAELDREECEFAPTLSIPETPKTLVQNQSEQILLPATPKRYQKGRQSTIPNTLSPSSPSSSTRPNSQARLRSGKPSQQSRAASVSGDIVIEQRYLNIPTIGSVLRRATNRPEANVPKKPSWRPAG